MFGKGLILDGDWQSAQKDEHLYHEALVQPAMHLHENPNKVLILGGGEGATLREVLKHDVEKAVMVDIDERVVELCKAHLPEWHKNSFSDRRAVLHCMDAFKYIEKCKEKFDVIVVDVTDPSSELASRIFSENFYESLKNLMDENSICVFQAGGFIYQDMYKKILKSTNKVFGFSYPYKNFIPSFFMEWGFILASKSPLDIENVKEKPGIKNIFYDGISHKSMFSVSV
jgi:spermidine synthase